jgi:hypothetical protein
MKKFAALFAVIFFFSSSTVAFAINDVNITEITNFSLDTFDTATPTTIRALAGGVATNLYVETNYIDLTIDNLSDITFSTTVAGNYLKITKQSGSSDYTLSPACPTTSVKITGTGAQVVFRLQVYTTDQCSVVTPPSGGGGGGGGGVIRPDISVLDSPFIDIEGHWAESYIDLVYNLGYVQGYEDITFRPDQPITRAEASKLIALWYEKNITSSSCLANFYSDVSCDEWYGGYIGFLSDKGVLQGYNDGTFRPGQNVTRAEALKIMLYAKELQNTDIVGVDNPFSDIFFENWYHDVVIVGYKLSIIQGYEDGTFRPNNSITRAEFTKIFAETFL